MQDSSTTSIPPLKRTKIIATVGPATHSYEKVRELIAAGANGLRLNFSHGDHEEHGERIQWIRQASKELNKPVAIIQDLQGPKIRLGTLVDNHYDVKVGDEITLAYGSEHDGGSTLPIQYDLSARIEPGERVYLFDGKVRAVALSIDKTAQSITIRIENDGFLMSRKGLNLPDTNFEGDVITEKDYADIDYGVTQDIDFVALSFVQSATDIQILRGYLATKNSNLHIIAKIETKAAIEDGVLEEIVEASDAVMVARGDLAVEVGAEIVPVVQRQIIGLCEKHAKIAIVATQMMSSMVDNPEPTRAEVSDVATSVICGVDSVMLSDETANGSFPIEAVASMKRVILYTQEHVPMHPLSEPVNDEKQAMEICKAAVMLAHELDAGAIVAETKSGATAQNIAANRPSLPIFSVTSDPRVAQQLTLLYATKSFLRPDSEKAGLDLIKDLTDQEFIGSPAKVVIVSGRQPGLIGGTDTIRVRVVE